MGKKVFAIGLSKTGTTSLTLALKHLGYRANHFPLSIFEKKGGKLRLLRKNVDRFDAVSDLPPAAFYKELDKAFPDSKFILTVRNKKKWLDSCKKHFWWGQLVPEWWPFKDKVVMLHYDIYGAKDFDEKKFAKAYDKHVREVKEYFKGKDNLLVMDITKGEEWDKLCDFLDAKKPMIPFPKKDRLYSVIFNRILKLPGLRKK